MSIKKLIIFSLIIFTIYGNGITAIFGEDMTPFQIKLEAMKIINPVVPEYYDHLKMVERDEVYTVGNIKGYQGFAKDGAKDALDELKKDNLDRANELLQAAKAQQAEAYEIRDELKLRYDLNLKKKHDELLNKLPDSIRPSVEYVEGKVDAILGHLPSLRAAELEYYEKLENGGEANFGEILGKKVEKAAIGKIPVISEILLIVNTLEATSLTPQKRIKEFLDYLETLNLREYFRAYKEAKAIVDSASRHLNGPNREFFAIDSINQANATMLRPEHIQLISRNENRQQKVGSLERFDASSLVERTARDQVTNVLTPISSTSTTRAIIASLLNFSVSTTALPVWQSTGLNISAGNLLEVTAAGLVGWDFSASTVGPDGQGSVGAGDTTHLVTTQGVPKQSLVGQIGAASTLDGSGFFVGSNFSGEASATGTLFLGFNDGFIRPDRSGVNGGGIGDNSGSFTTDITIRE